MDWLLNTKAKDNRGREYPVQIKEQDGALVLSIVGTPGQWRLSSLLKDSPQKGIYIDFGQKWACVNFDEVMREAVAGN